MQATMADQGKRNSDSVDLSDPESTTAAKTAKCVSQVILLFGSLSGQYRVAKSSSPRSHLNIAPTKPSGLTGRAKSATTHPIILTANEDDESSATEDEVIDDLEYSTSSKDSLVRPPISHVSLR